MLCLQEAILGGIRISNDNLWQQYVEGKQTYAQLALKYGCSIKTIQRRIDKANVNITEKCPREVIVLMDTTYFGRSFGVMLFRDPSNCSNLYKIYVSYETNQAYLDGIKHLENNGYKIKGIVCDGRKGLIQILIIFLFKCVSSIKWQLSQDTLRENPRCQQQ